MKNKNQLSAFELFINCLREVKETKKNIKKLNQLELSMQALQELVDTVALGSNEVEIEVQIKDGNNLIIRRAKTDNAMVPFAERYKKEKAGRVPN